MSFLGSNSLKASNGNLSALPPRQPSPIFTLEPLQYPHPGGPGSSGTRTPTQDHRPFQRRKTTLISLIDELSQLRDEENEKEKLTQAMNDEKGVGCTLRVIFLSIFHRARRRPDLIFLRRGFS